MYGTSAKIKNHHYGLYEHMYQYKILDKTFSWNQVKLSTHNVLNICIKKCTKNWRSF